MTEDGKTIELRLGNTTFFPLLSTGNVTIFGYPVKIERVIALRPHEVRFRVVERTATTIRSTSWWCEQKYSHLTVSEWADVVFNRISTQLDKVETINWHSKDFVIIKEPETKEDVVTEPREFPTARWESALNNAAVTFFTVVPPNFPGQQPVVRYCKNATGRGVSTTRGRTSKVTLVEFIVSAQKNGNDVYICWPGSTQDIFKMSPEDIEIVLEKLGFVPQDKLTVEIGGRKYVYTED